MGCPVPILLNRNVDAVSCHHNAVFHDDAINDVAAGKTGRLFAFTVSFVLHDMAAHHITADLFRAAVFDFPVSLRRKLYIGVSLLLCCGSITVSQLHQLGHDVVGG